MKNYTSKLVLFTALIILTFNLNSQERINLIETGMHRGAGRFIFRDAKGNRNKPITLYYYVPSNYNNETKIVFIMPGATRAGRKNRDRFISYAVKYGFILIVPEFSRKHYPSLYYQGGNVLTRRRKKVPEKYWTYTAIENIFDYVKKLLNNDNGKYYIFGHSAGGQFVHRMVIFKPNARFKIAVAANAGHYTFPILTTRYIYGLKYTHVTMKSLKKSFSRKLVILAGDKDTKTRGRWVPSSAGALRQGRHRFARAKNFYRTSKNQARRFNAAFNWDFFVVRGVGHSSSGTYKFYFPKIFKPVKSKLTEKLFTGAGNIVFKYNGKKIHVWYYKPYKTGNTGNVVFLMHGGRRDGKNIRDRRIRLAVKYNFILIAPEFDKEQFSKNAFYMGNVFKRGRRKLNPVSLWTFPVIDKIFNYVKRKNNLTQNGYYIFGNTGSAYFPYRMAVLYPQNKAKGIAISNLTYYTYVNYSKRFPYGLKYTGINNSDFKIFYSKNVLIMSGSPAKQKYLRDRYKNQGAKRFHRALNYYEFSRNHAARIKGRFNWKFVLVKSTRWSYYRMLERALKIWFNNFR